MQPREPLHVLIMVALLCLGVAAGAAAGGAAAADGLLAPGWWRSPWAVILGTFVLGSAVAAVERWRINRLLSRQAELESVIEDAVHELEVANQELQARNSELKELNALKSEFLGIAAHDLKNPLGVIMGLSEIMEDQALALQQTHPELGASMVERLSLIRHSTEHMASLVGHLLETVALESGEVQLARARTALPALASAVVDSHRLKAMDKDITLEFAERSPTWADADPERLWEILDNLVSNAIKFSPRGRAVEVGVAEHGAMARVWVRDEGPGLTLKDRDRLFGRFQRLSARPTAGESSTGLGLSIVKRLVDLHGGHIWVESEAGRGATFIVEIPRAAAPERRPPSPASRRPEPEPALVG